MPRGYNSCFVFEIGHEEDVLSLCSASLLEKIIDVCLFIFWPKIYRRFKKSFTLTITVKSSWSWLTRILSKKKKMSTKGKWEPFHSIYVFTSLIRDCNFFPVISLILITMPLLMSNLYLERLFERYLTRLTGQVVHLTVCWFLIEKRWESMTTLVPRFCTFIEPFDHMYCLSSCLKIFSSRHSFRPNLLPLDLR